MESPNTISLFRSPLRVLTETQKSRVAKEFWDTVNDGAAHEAFYDYFINEVDQIRHHREKLATEKLQETISIVQLAKRSHDKPLSDLVQELQVGQVFDNANDRAIQRSLELSIRLWLTINIHSSTLEVGPNVLLELPITWERAMSLNDLIGSRWGQTSIRQKVKSRAQVEDMFTAAYLVNVCGISLQWTNYLSDHLAIDSRRKVLTVYKHKVYLSHRLEESQEPIPIPKSVLEEALDTLILLFPFGDEKTRQLLARQGELGFYRLGNCKRRRELNMQRYHHWKEELEILVDIYNRPPQSWKQLATDRRNLTEWAAFWVTVMVAILTLVSIPCSIIQATYSVKAYHAALVQANTFTVDSVPKGYCRKA